MFKAHDLKGKKINRLQVLDKVKRGRYWKWRCLCDCGNETFVSGSEIYRGAVKSCGCFRNEVFNKIISTHGLSKTKLYSVWQAMIARCTYTNIPDYKNYGGRGIKICKSWMKFENFYKDMSPTYKEHLTLDRTNNDKGYNKKNCRWATYKEQLNNTRRNHILTYKGKEYSISQLAESLSIKEITFRGRIRRGWSVEKAIIGISK